MMQIELPRNWYLVIVGVAEWQLRAQDLSVSAFKELKAIIDEYISSLYRSFRKKGAIVTSLLWSQENLSPIFLLEVSNRNRQFLTEIRNEVEKLPETILKGLAPSERESALGRNIQFVAPEGRILILPCKIPAGSAVFPSDSQVIKVFSDALNSELITIKRAEHDFLGRKSWLSNLESVLVREWIREVGPVQKIRAAKELEGRRQYDKKTPGDFEKIVRFLSEAVPYRESLFELQKYQPSLDEPEPLGHIIIQYLSTKGDLPIKLHWRSVTHERFGRKVEEMLWAISEGVDFKELDRAIVISEEMVYENVERAIIDMGGIKLDGFWTERDLSSNVFFLSKFTFTEDTIKGVKEFISNPGKQLEKKIGIRVSEMEEIWQRAGLHYNFLVFEVRGFDSNEEKKLVDWIKSLKEKKIPGPSYCAEWETIVERNFRPF